MLKVSCVADTLESRLETPRSLLQNSAGGCNCERKKNETFDLSLP